MNFYDDLGRLDSVGEAFDMASSDFDNPDVDNALFDGRIKISSKTIYGKPSVKNLTDLGIDNLLAQI